MTIRRRVAESTLVQMRVADDLLARIDNACAGRSRTAWFLGLAARELDEAASGDRARHANTISSAGPRSIGPGMPSPGVTCMWAACMNRDTSRYGATDPAELTRDNYRDQKRDEDTAGHVLCKHHAAQLEGRTYSAPMEDPPPAWRSKAKQPERAGQPV